MISSIAFSSRYYDLHPSCTVHIRSLSHDTLRAPVHMYVLIITSSFAHFSRSATSPSFAYVSNRRRTALCAELLLPIASASAAAP